jgi:hypothetical protein
MAINLNFQAAPVTPYAKQSPEGKANEIMRIGSAIGGVIQQYGELRDEREILQSQTRRAEADTAINSRMGDKFYYSGDELENTEYKGQRIERDFQGNEVAKSIPAYEAEPFIRKRDQIENLNNAASGISNWMNKQKFIEQGKQEIEQQFERDLAFADKEARLHVRFEVGQQLNELMRTGNHDRAFNVLDATSVYNNDEKAEMRQKLAIDGEIFDARQILIKPEWTVADAAIAQQNIDYLADEKYSGPLDTDKKISLIGELSRRLASHEAGLRAEKQLSDIRYEMFLDEQIQSENPDAVITESTLWGGLESGALSRDAYKRLEGKIISRDIKLQQKLNKITSFAASLNTGFKPAPSPENQSLVNDLYDHELNKYIRTVGGPQNAKAMDVVEIGLATTRKSGMIPQQIQGEWAAANSGDAQQMLAGAKLYNLYKQTAPEATDRVSTQNFSTMANVAARLSLGVSEPTALDAAIKVRDMSNIERDSYKMTWQAATNGKTGQPLSSTLRASFTSFLEDSYDHDTGDAPGERQAPCVDGIPTDSIVMYENMVQAHFERGNDMSVAEKLAQDDFKKIYRLSNINDPKASALFGNGGNQLMAYAPSTDKFTTEQIHKQLLSEFSDQLKEGEKLFVYSDALTLRTGALNPEQAIFKVKGIDADGVPRILGTWKYDLNKARKEQIKVTTKENISRMEAELTAMEQAKLDYATNVGGEINSPSVTLRKAQLQKDIAIQKEVLSSHGQ